MPPGRLARSLVRAVLAFTMVIPSARLAFAESRGPSLVTCCRTSAEGATKCSLKGDAAPCRAPKGGQACAGIFASCDECLANGCPTTTTSTSSTTTTTLGAVCGNNVIEPGEQCDGTSGCSACGAPGELDACCCQHTFCNVYARPACPCGDQFCAEFIPGGDGYCYPRTCAPFGALLCEQYPVPCCAPYVCDVVRPYSFTACCIPAGERCVLAGGTNGCCSQSCNPDTLTCDP